MRTMENHMMFFDRAMEEQRGRVMTGLADAISECHTAAEQMAELTPEGEIGLMRLVEILCAVRGGFICLEGPPVPLMANVLAQIYVDLTQRTFDDPIGLAIYVELNYMLDSLMLGDWYE